jgi:hypothetical protein
MSNFNNTTLPANAVKKLVALGVIPRLCKRWVLTIEHDAAATATATYIVTEAELEKIATVFSERPEETKQFVEKTIYTDRKNILEVD